MNPLILKSKTLQPLEKLILLHLDQYPSYLPYQLTSAVLAKILGSTRGRILAALESLQNAGYIKCRISPPIRTTTITAKFREEFKQTTILF